MNAHACPNDPPCDHPGLLHDVYDAEDPYPTCCVGDCRCGHPGDATLRHHEDGTVTVIRADPVIRVARELLDASEPWAYDGETLQLDTAGQHRYRYLRPDPRDHRVLIFGRVADDAP